MIDTGVIRKLDDLGRITLPMELRRNLGITDRDALHIFVEDRRIILEKYCPTDVFTGSREDLIEFHGKRVSKESIKEMAKLAGLKIAK